MTQEWNLPSSQKKPGKVAYTNARLIDPESGLDEVGGLLTDGDKIVDFGKKVFKDGIPKGATEVDCGGQILCPGLLDIQVHFRDPGQLHKETIETGSKAAVAGGITTVVCQPNTTPTLDDVTSLTYLKKRAEEVGYNNIRTYACISKDMKGEFLTDMALLKDTGIVVGFTDDGLPVMNSLLMRRALEHASELDLPIAQHAEDIVLTNGGCIAEGPVATQLGVRGTSNATEAIIVERDCLLLEITGGSYHVLHISTRQSIDAVRRAKAKGLNVTCEASPHHFTLNYEAVLDHGTNAKMNPPLRSEDDRQAVLEGLKDGTIDAIATDHAPHDIASKELPLSKAAFGIIGVETMLPLSLQLVRDKVLTLPEMLGKMTYQAADIVRQPVGRLKKGARADLTIFDPDMTWVCKADALSSLSKNTPFMGQKMTGRATRTVVSGRTVYTLS